MYWLVVSRQKQLLKRYDIRSHVNDLEIRELFRSALTDKINGR